MKDSGSEPGPRQGPVARDTTADLFPSLLASHDTRRETVRWLRDHGQQLLRDLDAMERVACDGTLSLIIGEATASLKAGQGATALVKLSQALALASSSAAKLGRGLSERGK